MSNGKETKRTEKPSRDPQQITFDGNEFFANRLALPVALKEKLKKEGLVFRFLNANEFRKNGNLHGSHWVPYKLDCNPTEVGLHSLSAEGLIQRGDLILGVRRKEIAEAHKRHLSERNKSYQGYQKEKARELRKILKDGGMENDSRVYEGYEDAGEE